VNQRSRRISATLQQAIQSVISRGLADPRIRGLITVTEVAVSQDRREATVRISVLPEEHEDLTMHGLVAGAKHIRRAAADLVAVHPMPRLHFKLDRSLKAQAGVLQAIARSRADTPDDDATDTTDTTVQPDDQPNSEECT